MVDTYIISLLMCSIIALIVAIGVFTLKTVRNEKRIEELESQVESLNHFHALQSGTNKETDEAIRMMSQTTAEVDRKVSNILNKMTVSIHGKNVHMEGDVEDND